MARLTEIRLSLVAARASFRAAKDTHELVTAEAEQRAIEAGATGKNAEERARALTIALNRDPLWLRSRTQLRHAEAEVERLQALLDSQDADRRAYEWSIRAGLVDALQARGHAAAEPVDVSAFETLPDELTTRRAFAEVDELYTR